MFTIELKNKVHSFLPWAPCFQSSLTIAYPPWPSKIHSGVVGDFINHERMSPSSFVLVFLQSFALNIAFTVYMFILTGCEDSASSLPSDDSPTVASQNESGQAEVNRDKGVVENQVRDSQRDSFLNSENTDQDQQGSERQDEFYDPQAVQQIELHIDEQDRQAMLSALPELIYVPATFKWREIEIENVGVRFKGTSSSQPNSWWKRSFLIKFGEYVEGQ